MTFGWSGRVEVTATSIGVSVIIPNLTDWGKHTCAQTSADERGKPATHNPTGQAEGECTRAVQEQIRLGNANRHPQIILYL
ncbi:MAG TPA: hypothetical protein PKK23_20835 [Nitrospirales bacterium]|nr:hypothetical protein [Nitrospirales bacterium]